MDDPAKETMDARLVVVRVRNGYLVRPEIDPMSPHLTGERIFVFNDFNGLVDHLRLVLRVGES